MIGDREQITPLPPGASIRMPGDPHHNDLIRELRVALGMFAGAMPITPQQAWEEALDRVRQLREDLPEFRCPNCDHTTRARLADWETHDGPA